MIKRNNMFSRRHWQASIRFERPQDEGFGWYLPFLLILSMASAAIDVFSVPALGVFTANNTGNLIFLAISAGQIHLDTIHPVAAITSLAASWVGSFYSGQVGHRVGRSKRWFVFADTLAGALLAILCAALYYGRVFHFNDGRTEYAAIALLSFSMGAQNVTTAGTSPPNTITTVVATGAMAGLLSDRGIFLRHNRPRDERLSFILIFFTGGLIGAFAYRYSSAELCLLLSGIFKLIAAFVAMLVPEHVDISNNVKATAA